MPKERENFPEINQLNLVIDGIAAEYPDNIMIVPARIEGEEALRMRDAGTGLAEVHLPGDEKDPIKTVLLNYSYAPTPITRAIEKIGKDEQTGKLPSGSYQAAYNHVRDGTFKTRWGQYLDKSD